MWIAILTVIVSLAVAIPAGYALARVKLRWRGLILLAFLLPQAIPNLPVYVNIARVFYELGLAGTIPGVVLVHASHGLVLAVWIASAAFAAVDPSLEEAARNMGASPLACFRTVTLPLAAPGLMASAIFVFLESLDEFTGTYFVGVPDVMTLPLLMFNASMGGNYQIASITALLLLVPSVGFMLVVERFLKADVLAMVGRCALVEAGRSADRCGRRRDQRVELHAEGGPGWVFSAMRNGCHLGARWQPGPCWRPRDGRAGTAARPRARGPHGRRKPPRSPVLAPTISERAPCRSISRRASRGDQDARVERSGDHDGDATTLAGGRRCRAGSGPEACSGPRA